MNVHYQMSSLEQLRTHAQRNDHCRISSLNRYNYYRLKSTGRLALRLTDQIILHKTVGHKGSQQYFVEKNLLRIEESVKNLFHHRQAGRNNQRLHHQTHNPTITSTGAPLAIPQL